MVAVWSNVLCMVQKWENIISAVPPSGTTVKGKKILRLFCELPVGGSPPRRPAENTTVPLLRVLQHLFPSQGNQKVSLSNLNSKCARTPFPMRPIKNKNEPYQYFWTQHNIIRYVVVQYETIQLPIGFFKPDASCESK